MMELETPFIHPYNPFIYSSCQSIHLYHSSIPPSIYSSIPLVIHSYTFIPPSLYSFIHSFIHIYSSIPPIIHSFLHTLFIHPSSHSFIYIYSSISLFIHSFIHSFIHIYSSIPPIIHSFLHTLFILPPVTVPIHFIHPSHQSFIHSDTLYSFVPPSHSFLYIYSSVPPVIHSYTLYSSIPPVIHSYTIYSSILPFIQAIHSSIHPSVPPFIHYVPCTRSCCRRWWPQWRTQPGTRTQQSWYWKPQTRAAKLHSWMKSFVFLMMMMPPSPWRDPLSSHPPQNRSSFPFSWRVGCFCSAPAASSNNHNNIHGKTQNKIQHNNRKSQKSSSTSSNHGQWMIQAAKSLCLCLCLCLSDSLASDMATRENLIRNSFFSQVVFHIV